MSMIELEKQTTATPLTDKQRQQWQDYALSQFPKEACAYIVDGRIVPVSNVSETPLETFAVSVVDRLNVEAMGTIEGFLHTHCHTPLQAASHWYPTYWPSSHDMRGWLHDNVRWGISACDGEVVTPPVWLDENYTAPLKGRQFIHGIHDCYAAVRDWFKVNRAITLNNYPRGMEWWNNGEDLYAQQFEHAGFVEIKQSEATAGDCVLFSINSHGVISHAAVLVDTNTIFHHTFSRTGEAFSREEPFQRWAKHAVKFVRYSPKQ